MIQVVDKCNGTYLRVAPLFAKVAEYIGLEAEYQAVSTHLATAVVEPEDYIGIVGVVVKAVHVIRM